MGDALRKHLSVDKTISKKQRSSKSSDSRKKTIDPPDSPSAPQSQGSSDPCFGSAAEYDVPHPTGDKMRDKVRKLLTDALFHADESYVSSKDDAAVVANAVEDAMFRKYEGCNGDYKSKYRNISFNLKDKKNGKLRMAVLGRHLMPSELLQLSNQELANDDLKKARKEVHQKMTRDAMPYNKQEASTDMFKCGKCKQRKCTYFQMQTRSADEPLTTFVSCVNCGNRWRF